MKGERNAQWGKPKLFCNVLFHCTKQLSYIYSIEGWKHFQKSVGILLISLTNSSWNRKMQNAFGKPAAFPHLPSSPITAPSAFTHSTRKWSIFSLALQKQINFSLTSPKSPVNADSCVFPLFTGMPSLPLWFSPACIAAPPLPSSPASFHYSPECHQSAFKIIQRDSASDLQA